MVRIIAAFFLCLVSVSAQESGLQLTIGTEQIAPGIEGMPRKLTVIAVTTTNPGDSPQSLVVGTDYNNADHWDVSVNLMNRDGTIVALSRVPRHAVLITGYVGNVVIEIPAHGSYRTLLNASDFEEDTGHGGTTNLAGFISAPGLQVQVVLHCGAHIVPGALAPGNSWKGDLVSGWLKFENPNPNR
jgi:hypothetical protein